MTSWAAAASVAAQPAVICRFLWFGARAIVAAARMRTFAARTSRLRDRPLLRSTSGRAVSAPPACVDAERLLLPDEREVGAKKHPCEAAVACKSGEAAPSVSARTLEPIDA
jgi:hypothetical protein